MFLPLNPTEDKNGESKCYGTNKITQKKNRRNSGIAEKSEIKKQKRATKLQQQQKQNEIGEQIKKTQNKQEKKGFCDRENS